MSVTQLALFQKQIMNTLNMFDNKIVNIYKLGSQQYTKFGFNIVSPQYTLDVDDKVNVTGDYYIRGQLFLPTGTILPYAGPVTGSNSTLNGWIICDGQSLNRNDYQNLYDIIGTRYGSNSSSTFNIPDMRGRVPIGSSVNNTNGLSSRNIADTGGEETHTLTINEMPSHTHTYADAGSGSYTTTPAATSDSADDVTVGRTTNATGGSQAHNNMQPYIVINYIIRY